MPALTSQPSESQRIMKVLNRVVAQRQQLAQSAASYGDFAALLAKQNSRENMQVARMDDTIFRLQRQVAKLKARGM